jgi:hypothetical protein
VASGTTVLSISLIKGQMILDATPLIVVSVVNWNTAGSTIRCLRSLLAMTYPNFRVVVVDNASVDASAVRIRHSFPRVTVIESPFNCGFAAGHDLARRQAERWSGSAVWLVNSDAVVDPLALTYLVAAWQEQGDAIFGGVPLVRDESGTVWLNFPQKYLRKSATPHTLQRDDDIEFTEHWQTRDPFRVSAVPGSSLFIPLGLVRAFGWMDNTWFLYCEEIDYCYRLRKLGVQSMLVPKSQIWHHGGGSHTFSTRVTDCIQYYRARNEIVLAQRHSSCLFAGLIALKKICRGAFVGMSNPRRAAMILRGVLHALRGRMGKTIAPEDALNK